MGFDSSLNRLSPPPQYFPVEKGKYEVAPNLRGLGMDFGNGRQDTLFFQFEKNFPRYRKNKEACRAERLSKYYCTHEFAPEVQLATVQFFLNTLPREYPEFFGLKGSLSLECKLTEETLHFDEKGGLLRVDGQKSAPPYLDSYDALVSQISEDSAVTMRREGRDWLAALHLCSPAHWSAEQKIGKSFVDVHRPVAGVEKMNATANQLVDASIRKGPYTRFVWGFATDDRLNHHPEPPPGVDPVQWKGRSFNRNREGSPFILRFERQVVVGLPEVEASLFFIKTYFIDGDKIRGHLQHRDLLKAGLLSMDAAQLRYKGLEGCLSEVIHWLDEPSMISNT